jgi:hypothetical protein
MIIDSVVLPFLGSRVEDQVCFEYLLTAVDPERVDMVIPRWVVNRERLKVGDTIHFNLPFELDGRPFTRGTVETTQWNEGIESQECSIRLDVEDRIPKMVPLSLYSREGRIDLKGFSPPEGLLHQAIKDSILLKKGILIYLGHLTPYFSRISEFPADEYKLLRGYLFEDIRVKIQGNEAKLEALYQKLGDACCSQADITGFVDLEELRSFMESEIYSNLFNITFDNALITQYIRAIKELEHKLYYNYNTIVMLFIKYL